MCAKSLPLGNQREGDVLTVEIRTLLSSSPLSHSRAFVALTQFARARGVFAVVAVAPRGDDGRDAKRRGYLGYPSGPHFGVGAR